MNAILLNATRVYRVIMPRKSNKDKGKRSKNGKGKKNNNWKNPWEYKTELPVLLEPQKLDQDKVATLCYRDQYGIKPVKYQDLKDHDDKVYKMFGELVGQLAEFMRHWLRCNVLTHKKTVSKLAWEYLKSKGMKLSTWISSVCSGKRADVLALLLLCKITETQCFVHCMYNSY